ncbi:replication factor-A protein [Thozetella sp. PMI_491]|nr:replication factor-A protein [Thozetella sp. PMI_491]
MAEQAISQGAISAFFNDEASKFPVPVLQCLQIKTLEAKGAGGAAERYRVVLSDMHNYVQGMLATQANHVVHDGKLQRGCIVRLKQYQAQSLKGKNILIILDLEVIESYGTPDKLGEPTAIEGKSTEPQNTTIGGAGFYGAKSEPQDSKSQVQREIAQTRTDGPSHDNGMIYPIEAVSPYARKWTIKARVTSKSDIKYWHKPGGNEGKLFSVNLLDESGEIKATAFNDQCDQFFDVLQEGGVYFISTPCRVSMAKKQFNNLANEYEMSFERDTVIEKCEDTSAVPQVRFNFCTIQELQNVEKDATVDVIGVLKEVQEVSQITSKTSGKPYDKRELTIVDDTGFSVRVTIWGKTATAFDAAPESVVAFKGTRVGDFGGRSLSLLSSGTMAVDPDIPEAHKLKGWYDASGRNDSFSTHNNMSSMGTATGRKDETKVISQIKDENLGMENVDYFTLKATVVYIRQETFAYPACRTEGCNRKVTATGDGGWRCEKCDITHEKPTYRYIMSVNVNDHTGQLWLSCFDEVAKKIMNGKSADDLMEIQEQDESRLAAEFEAANCRKLTFRCRAKMDSFNDTQRVRYQVMSAAPLDFTAEANALSELIKQMDV